MKNTIRLGMLSAALMISLGAHGAGLELKPVEAVKPLTVKPAVTVQGAGSAVSFGQMNQKPNAANTNAEASIKCPSGPLSAGEIYNRVSSIAPDINVGEISDLIRGGYLTRGTCTKPLEKLSPEALANAIRLARNTKSCMSGQDASGNKGQACRIKANEKVFGMEHAEAVENESELAKGCQYLGEAA